jgi:hypothetical protein
MVNLDAIRQADTRHERNRAIIDARAGGKLIREIAEAANLTTAMVHKVLRQGEAATIPPPTEQERFWAKVDVGHPLGCWTWTAALTNGYGVFSLDGRKLIAAHRYAYMQLRGPIPDGMVIDHLCRNPPCVNPDHLEVVTRSDNVLRGYGQSAQHARTGLCKNGHVIAGDNVYAAPSTGKRRCRTCMREAQKRNDAEARDARGLRRQAS